MAFKPKGLPSPLQMKVGLKSQTCLLRGGQLHGGHTAKRINCDKRPFSITTAVYIVLLMSRGIRHGLGPYWTPLVFKSKRSAAYGIEPHRWPPNDTGLL